MADDHTIHSQHITRQQARHHLHLPGAANSPRSNSARPPSYCCVQLSRFTTSQHLQLNFQSVSFCGQQQLPLFMYNIRMCIEEPNQEVLTDDTASDGQTDRRTDGRTQIKQAGNPRHQTSALCCLLSSYLEHTSCRHCQHATLGRDDVTHKPEVHAISQQRQGRIELQLRATCSDNLVKFGCLVFEIRSRRDRQTAHGNTRQCYGGRK